MEDERIVALYDLRDERAVAETMAKYGGALHRLAERIVGDHAVAEECVNDTCLKVWDAVPPARPLCFSAYLFQICRREALERVRREQAQKRAGVLTELTEEMALCIPDKANEEAVALRELGEILSQFLHTVSRAHRVIFLRRYWYAESVEDIAAHEHISVSNVKTSLHRTRRKLRRYLQKEGVGI